ncbi:type VI secretion protein, partial [Escherichia coli]
VVTWFELGENDKNQMLYSMRVCPPLWRTMIRCRGDISPRTR